MELSADLLQIWKFTCIIVAFLLCIIEEGQEYLLIKLSFKLMRNKNIHYYSAFFRCVRDRNIQLKLPPSQETTLSSTSIGGTSAIMSILKFGLNWKVKHQVIITLQPTAASKREKRDTATGMSMQCNKLTSFCLSTNLAFLKSSSANC